MKNAKKEDLLHFKRYLETRGASLSKTDKYLPFYALPYISNPREHKAFKHIAISRSTFVNQLPGLGGVLSN